MNKEEIQARMEKVKEIYRERKETQTSRLDKIRELLLKLKAGFDYMEKHPDEPEKNQRLIERAKPIIEELKTLGVHETFSLALLVNGPIITDDLTNQFYN